MKKLLKIIFIVFGAFIVLGVVGSMLGDDAGQESKLATQEEKTQEDKKDPVKNQPEEKKESKSTITKENYEKIKVGDTLTGEGGMTIEQVEAIFGEPDNSIESNSGDMKMIDMTWTTGILEMKSVGVMFINGKVSNKTWLE